MNRDKRNTIIFKTGIGPYAEGYKLNVMDGRIEFTALNSAGFFFGIQILRQLLLVE